MEIVLTSIRCPWAEDSCRHNTRRRTKASSSNPNNGHVALVTNTTALHHCISCSCDLIHWFSSPFTTDNTLPVVAMTVYLGGCYARDASSFRRQWQRQLRRLRLERQENKVPCIWRATYLWRKNHCVNFLDIEIGISSNYTSLGVHKGIRVKIVSVTPTSYLSFSSSSNSAFSLINIVTTTSRWFASIVS